jgi:acyl-CoA thioesterase FadM
MQQTISREAMVLAVLKVVIVAITAEGRPQRWPPQLRQIFTIGTGD